MSDSKEAKRAEILFQGYEQMIEIALLIERASHNKGDERLDEAVPKLIAAAFELLIGLAHLRRSETSAAMWRSVKEILATEESIKDSIAQVVEIIDCPAGATE